MSLMILGYFLDTSSIFVPFFILMLVIGVLIAGIVSYVWEQFSVDSTLSTTISSKFRITNHLLSNFTVYFTVIGAMAMIALYAKSGGGER